MMKKLLTLLAAGLVITPSFAQSNSKTAKTGGNETITNKTVSAAKSTSTNVAAPAHRGTATTPAWFNYAKAQFQDGVSNLNTYATYQDSSLKFSTGTYLGFYGFGFSFDPTSRGYTVDAYNPAATVPFTVLPSNAYSVDSVEVNGFYQRNSPNTSVVDTLYVEVVVSATPSTFQLQFSGQPDNSDDGIARFNTALYDRATNKMSDSVTSKQVIKKILNAAAFADSSFFNNDIGYLHNFKLKLPTVINAAAGQKIVAFAHFVSGANQPLGTSIDSANLWIQLTSEPTGQGTEMYQKNKETTSGLLVTRQIRYDTAATISFQGHYFLYPTLGYAAGAEFDYPYFGFRVNCPSCSGVGVADINNVAKIGKLYPNPANNTVSSSITMKENGNVNVSIINSMGQVIVSKSLGLMAANQTKEASFNTSAIANGVYFFTIEANGTRNTTRFVVAH